jgi:hypothetical protein
MSLVVLFHFLCAQHVSDINISIIMSLRLFCWITTLVVFFFFRCVLEIRCGWIGVVSVLQAEAVLCCVLEFRCGWVGVVSVLQSEAVLYISPTVKFLFSRYFSALEKLFHASQLHCVSRSYIYTTLYSPFPGLQLGENIFLIISFPSNIILLFNLSAIGINKFYGLIWWCRSSIIISPSSGRIRASPAKRPLLRHLRSIGKRRFNLLVPELFFLFLAHPVYKMWIIQEPNMS